jgi:protein-S-isoprenylcysteine O-methyltransferase Ste14
MDETAGNVSDRNGSIRIHPPLLALGLLLATLIIHLLGGHHHRVHFHSLAGLLLVAAGTGLSAYAAALFSARDTTRNPYGEPSQLVTIAPYTFTRNPMYLGVIIILLGFAVFFRSPVMVLAPIIFFLIIDRVVIPQEEQTLEHAFGAAYQDYRRRVRRWL